MNLKENQELVVINYWNGDNNVASRKEAGQALAEFWEYYNFKPDETHTEVSHSHGGNVLKAATQEYDGENKIDTMVFLGTPHRPDYQLDRRDMDPDGQIINVYDKGDLVQRAGGNPAGKGQQVLTGATNVAIYQTEKKTIQVGGDDFDDVFPPMTVTVEEHLGPIDSHSNLDSTKVWNEHVVPKLTNPQK